jgi:hypothetical protein
MRAAQTDSSGATRVAYILSVPLAGKVERQWPQMGQIVRTAELDAPVEGNSLQAKRIFWACPVLARYLNWALTRGTAFEIREDAPTRSSDAHSQSAASFWTWGRQINSKGIIMTAVHHRYATVAGRKLFYREAGPADAPAIVLLHGFPTSSFVAAPGAAPEPPMDRALRQVDSIDALRAWAEAYVDQLERNDFRDGCVLSALAGPLAAANPAARADVGTGLTRWVTELAGSLRAIRDRGELCPEADPDTLASSLLATLLGGTLLAKTMRDIAPLRSAIAAVMASVQSPATVQEAE